MAKPNRKVFWASHFYLIGLLLFSLKHFWTEGDHLWTDEGTRLSWSIHLRGKVCTYQMQDSALRDPVENLLWHRVGFENLTFWQRIHMNDPFLFSLYVKAQFCPFQKEVFAKMECRAIGHTSAPLIDPHVDLCQVDYHFLKHNPWIYPYPGEAEPEFRQWFSYHSHPKVEVQ